MAKRVTRLDELRRVMPLVLCEADGVPIQIMMLSHPVKNEAGLWYISYTKPGGGGSLRLSSLGVSEDGQLPKEKRWLEFVEEEPGE